MPITTSRIGTVIDALVVALKASATFADPGRVYDGPLTGEDTYWTQAVFIGFDGAWQGPEYDAVDLDQQLNYLGNTSMFEEFDLHCVAQGWSGDTNIQAARNTALAMFAGVQQVVRTDETLGTGDGSTVTGMKWKGSLRYQFDEQGNVLARLPFDLHVITTLLTI